ncbi:CatB-related O-acetyltransferase [Petrotoga sp. Shatin.DS.tank11.9.2.9.3]|jgi:acetyltransferase-like isoleucine patch superfamily enzyme|uniref:CatB-related O-acetyltransferase n=1 Tax=Petrotoga sp. Shatin.DS.tank11.9.2.9.3 TaxID=1469556 RepID=UPI000EF223A0|nr:CatB-related O-acetyltransferase [Petrotoga sp. Shatin.DS.tank11.9.2.9.3]
MLKKIINRILNLYYNKTIPLKYYNKKYKIMKRTSIDNYSDIGFNTYIGYNCFITKSKIGNYCSIGNNVHIGPGEHDLNKISTSAIMYKNSYEELTKEDCTLGNDVWVGADAIVLRGVKIGDGAVIGANSVVTHDIPDFAVAVGSPAKVIKYRFSQKDINKIKKSNWWLYDKEKAKNIINQLENKASE